TIKTCLCVFSTAQPYNNAGFPVQVHLKDPWQPLVTALLRPLEVVPLQTGSTQGRSLNFGDPVRVPRPFATLLSPCRIISHCQHNKQAPDRAPLGRETRSPTPDRVRDHQNTFLQE